MQTMKNELKKFAPHGASQRQFFARNTTPKAGNDLLIKKKYNYDDLVKHRSPALFTYLETQNLNLDIHKRTPNNFEAQKRGSTVSPARIPTSPVPRNFDHIIFDNMGRSTPKFLAEEVQALSGGNSPKVATMDEIISSCNTVSKQAENKGIPKVLKRYSKQITKLVDGIDNYLVRRKSKE